MAIARSLIIGSAALLILTLVAVFAFFVFLVPGVTLGQAIAGLLIVGGISFLFATVAARAQSGAPCIVWRFSSLDRCAIASGSALAEAALASPRNFT